MFRYRSVVYALLANLKICKKLKTLCTTGTPGIGRTRPKMFFKITLNLTLHFSFRLMLTTDFGIHYIFSTHCVTIEVNTSRIVNLVADILSTYSGKLSLRTDWIEIENKINQMLDYWIVFYNNKCFSHNITSVDWGALSHPPNSSLRPHTMCSKSKMWLLPIFQKMF